MWDKSRAALMLENNVSDDKLAIQNIIDGDKYVNSQLCNEDLCGKYALFCDMCTVHSNVPCAKAYVEFSSENQSYNNGLLSGYAFEDLKGIQRAIDIDKYVKSQTEGRDLCRCYDEFCKICPLNSRTPCADAYKKYKAPDLILAAAKEPEVLVKKANEGRRMLKIATIKRVKSSVR